MKSALKIGTACAVFGAAAANAQNLVASYFFENTFASSTPGAPDLMPLDPLGLSGFDEETVFGTLRSIYKVNGDALPTMNQAGLVLQTEGLVPPDNYSAELVFKFLQREYGWRLILDSHNRLSDSAFYAEPGNRLQVYPVATGIDGTILNGEYHHVVLTVAPHEGFSSSVTAYLDGIKQFEVDTNIMDLSNAPLGALHLFADNVESGGQGEFSDANIAVLRMYDGALPPEQVAQLASMFLGSSCPCDLNQDGFVDDSDFVLFVGAYNILDCADPAMPAGCPTDFNGDSLVDDADFVIFVAAYNELVCP